MEMSFSSRRPAHRRHGLGERLRLLDGGELREGDAAADADEAVHDVHAENDEVAPHDSPFQRRRRPRPVLQRAPPVQLWVPLRRRFGDDEGDAADGEDGAHGLQAPRHVRNERLRLRRLLRLNSASQL